jgi:hypothetical protein
MLKNTATFYGPAGASGHVMRIALKKIGTKNSAFARAGS